MVPNLKQLGSKRVDEARPLNQLRQRGLGLLVKIFLQKLHTMLPLKNFHVILVNVIDTIQQYVTLGKDSTLGEMALEALKNLMLVMSSTGAFSPEQNPTGKELCDLAWAHIEPVCPGLREALTPSKKDEVPGKVESDIGNDNLNNNAVASTPPHQQQPQSKSSDDAS
mmetsp:Transcript_25031/g.40372  ORF Transcript_25031/g.40372 Transcript_25031/m.40372 type:complete len:167 (+) Transcript_25031:95-595(+)